MHSNDVKPRRSRLRDPLLGALVLAGLVATAAADHPVGPPIGNNRYKSAIQAGPQGTDRDDYTVDLAAGDRLSFTLKSPFQSGLVPEVQLLDPDGRDRIAEATVKERSGGKKLVMKPFAVDRTGTWAVRIGGRIASEGAYLVTFKVASAPRSVRAGESLGGAVAERSYEVDAVAGSLLDVDVTWQKGTAPVEIAAVEDPAGLEVVAADGNGAAALAKVRKRRSSLRKLPLGDRDGTFVIRVRAPDGPSSYRIRWRVRPPERPSGFRKLEPVEPHIIRPEIDPILGVEGRRIRIDAWNLSTSAAPRVLFGDAAGRDVIVDPSGGFLDVTAPPGEDDSLVAVTVVNPDGQASVADDLFFYVPPPVVTAIVDASGQPVVGGTSAGGDLVRIEGEHLRVGQLVRFGTGPQIVPVLRSGGLEVVTRAQEPGKVRVLVSDAFEHEALSDQEYEFKAAPEFGAQPFFPVVAGTDGTTQLLVRGQHFEDTDELLFDGEPVAFERITSTLLRFTPPAREDGTYEVGSRDRFGLLASPVNLRIKAPGLIDDVEAVGGAYVRGSEISIHGGTEVSITGSRFHVSDRVSIGGQSAVVESAGPGELVVTAPSGDAGLTDVLITDVLDQETTSTGAFRYVGYRDRSQTRAPSRTTVDDGSASRAAVGDLDGDGEADDVVLVSHDAAPGSRNERTRILIGSSAGALADATATRLPSAGSDSSGMDDLRATAVAVVDLDDANGADILIVGAHPDGDDYGELRWLVNDGTGDFDLDEDSVPGSTHRPAVIARDENGAAREVYSDRLKRGRPEALAIGDLDGDGDPDVVVGRSSFEIRHFGVDEAYVDFTVDPPYVSAADFAAHLINETRYYGGLLVVDNQLGDGNGLVDVTLDVTPSVDNDAQGAHRPAFHTRDLVLGDLDGDDDLDLVVTWDDPTTVTAYGLLNGSGTDTARVATRVLLNDGDGAFTDATADWMPAGADPEWFQASRVALADLDGDDDLDLVLVHAVDLDDYQGDPSYVRSALRVLRNDHDADTGDGGFVNVTSTALPVLEAFSTENLRGGALLVRDVDGDGAPDILVGTTSPAVASGQTQPALRLLSGTPDTLLFRNTTGFLPVRTTDSGEVDDVVLISDLSTESQPALLLFSESVPSASTGSRLLRCFDWQR